LTINKHGISIWLVLRLKTKNKVGCLRIGEDPGIEGYWHFDKEGLNHRVGVKKKRKKKGVVPRKEGFICNGDVQTGDRSRFLGAVQNDQVMAVRCGERLVRRLMLPHDPTFPSTRTVLRTTATLRYCPSDVLSWDFYGASLALTVQIVALASCPASAET
jgi:hypothetical protein